MGRRFGFNIPTIYEAVGRVHIGCKSFEYVVIIDHFDVNKHFVAFRVRRSRGKMYIGHSRLCVCL